MRSSWRRWPLPFCCMPAFAQRPGGRFSRRPRGISSTTRSRSSAPVPGCCGAIAVLGRYLALTLWPHPLAVDYSFDALGIGAGFVGGRVQRGRRGVLLALAIAPGGSAGATAFGLSVAASAYSLVSNAVLLIGTVMAERLFYIPTVGLVLARHPPSTGCWPGDAAQGQITTFALATVARPRRGGDVPLVRLAKLNQLVRERGRRIREARGRAWSSLARTAALDEPAQAETEFAVAIDILPTYAAAWYNLGNARARRGALESAAERMARGRKRAAADRRLGTTWLDRADARSARSGAGGIRADGANLAAGSRGPDQSR